MAASAVGRGSGLPEGAGQADRAEVVDGCRRLAAGVAALEAAVVPVAGETPEGGEVHDAALVVAGAGEPGGDACAAAEEPLVAAGVDHVLPHGAGRHQMRQRERVPGAAAPPERLRPHDENPSGTAAKGCAIASVSTARGCLVPARATSAGRRRRRRSSRAGAAAAKWA